MEASPKFTRSDNSLLARAEGLPTLAEGGLLGRVPMSDAAASLLEAYRRSVPQARGGRAQAPTDQHVNAGESCRQQGSIGGELFGCTHALGSLRLAVRRRGEQGGADTNYHLVVGSSYR